ncbi:MAG: hypothetical protein H0U92_13340 [Actinobacteria bacterium]|nr:hypothetical protein [Actinomycetota bacterium]
MRHVELAPAKLTLSLRITGVRADGFHLLDAEMVSVDLCDSLTFEDGDGLTLTGIDIPAGPLHENLVVRALRATNTTAHVTLDKKIPAGAGLGGGSSDAAAVLRWAGVYDSAVAVTLGGDVPFCVGGGRANVTGIGQKVSPLPHVDATYTLLTPPLHVSTPAVYQAWDELGGPSSNGPNDLEPAALRVCVELAQWRDQLGNATGVTPVLAGSGGTWFVAGAFPQAGQVVNATKLRKELRARREDQAEAGARAFGKADLAHVLVVSGEQAADVRAQTRVAPVERILQRHDGAAVDRVDRFFVVLVAECAEDEIKPTSDRLYAFVRRFGNEAVLTAVFERRITFLRLCHRRERCECDPNAGQNHNEAPCGARPFRIPIASSAHAISLIR